MGFGKDSQGGKLFDSKSYSLMLKQCLITLFFPLRSFCALMSPLNREPLTRIKKEEERNAQKSFQRESAKVHPMSWHGIIKSKD